MPGLSFGRITTVWLGMAFAISSFNIVVNESTMSSMSPDSLMINEGQGTCDRLSFKVVKFSMVNDEKNTR